MAELTREFEEATAAKLKCQQEAEATALTISLANRLVGGLVSEKVRWAESVKTMKKDEKTIGMVQSFPLFFQKQGISRLHSLTFSSIVGQRLTSI